MNLDQNVLQALIDVQRIISDSLNELYVNDQTVEVTELAEALIKVHASLAWTIGSYSRFGDSIQVESVLRRMFVGATVTVAQHQLAADLVKMKIAVLRKDRAA